MKSTRTTRFTDPSRLSHSWRVNVLRVLLLVALWLATVSTARAADGLARREWTVDGLVREALVYVPSNARTNARPVVFAFHGHGGTMNHAARTFALHAHWPEAIVVYPQGLHTPGRMSSEVDGGRTDLIMGQRHQAISFRLE